MPDPSRREALIGKLEQTEARLATAVALLPSMLADVREVLAAAKGAEPPAEQQELEVDGGGSADPG